MMQVQLDPIDLIDAKITGGGMYGGGISHLHIQLKNGKRYMVEPRIGRTLKIDDYEEIEG